MFDKEGIKFFLSGTRLLLVPLIVLCSVYFSNKYYNQLDKKVLWFIGVVTGTLMVFGYLFVVHNFDWWVYE